MTQRSGHSAPRDGHPLAALVVAAIVAVAVPALLAFNLPPSATFFNQAAALVGWGAFLAALCMAMPGRGLALSGGLAALQAAFGVLLAAALAAPLWTGLPWGLALSGAGLIAAAALAAQVGAGMQRTGLASAAFRALCVAMLVAGLGSVVVAVVQVFAPELTDNSPWIARSGIAGRAVGNLRQPNHLSSVLLWALIALAWLAESWLLRPRLRGMALALALPLLFAVVLSGSRTGAIGVVLLALWGLLDARLSRTTRIALGLAPVLYAAMWFGMAQWAAHGGQALGGTARLHESPLGSRRGIWLNSLALIAAQPWLGVGFGEFNFAWTLTPFPGRPTEFFDHAHDLPLQLAVELGLPLALLVLGLLCWALWAALRQALTEASPPPQRAALAMVVMVLAHSLVEYPLWYAYFLLPASFAFGLCLGDRAQAAPTDAPAQPGPQRTRPLLLAAMALLVGGVVSVQDYLRVVAIFSPAEDAAPLTVRIADGQRSLFFAHHADYAAATTAVHPSEAMNAFVRAPHFLLDARLMAAWARALDEAGDSDRARFLAQRLKEFHNEQAAEFFAPCQLPAEAGKALPFQCAEPARLLGYRDFR